MRRKVVVLLICNATKRGGLRNQAEMDIRSSDWVERPAERYPIKKSKLAIEHDSFYGGWNH